MSIKAVLWDIDGTLVDSEPLHLKALLAVCMQYKVDISDIPDDTFIGVNLNGVWDALKRRFPAPLTRDIWTSAIDEHYVRQSETLHAMPGAIETIQSLNALGIRQAAVSNSGRQVVDTNLAFLRTNGIFEFSMSLDDVSKAKPDPEPYLQALTRMEIEPSQALSVEDSHSGAKSAQAAGLTLVAYNNRGLPADLWIDDLKDLPSHLPNFPMK